MAQRVTMMDELKAVLPTFPPNTSEKVTRPDDYIVLAFKYRRKSETNSLGSFGYWSVYIYTKANTITKIDGYALQVKRLLKSKGYEITDSDNGDYYDIMLQRYRLEIEYRIPKGEILT